MLRNVVRSQLYAGAASLARMQLLNLQEKIFERLEGLITADQAVAAVDEISSFVNQVKHLVDLLFSDLHRLL